MQPYNTQSVKIEISMAELFFGLAIITAVAGPVTSLLAR
jgi:hypothetical protein